MVKRYCSSNLIVGCVYYSNRATSVKKCCNDYNTLLLSYIEYLDKLSKEAIVSGETASVLREFIKEVKKTKDLIKNIGKDYATNIIGFLNEIDEADDKLFKNKGRKYLTDEEFNNGRTVAKIEFSFETFGEWLESKFFSGPTSKQLVNKKSEMMQRVAKLNEYTITDLSRIQGNVKLVDKRYSKRLCNLNKELNRFNLILLKIAEIMSPYSNNFNKKNISSLKNLIKTSNEFRSKIIKNPEYNSISNDDIKYFADNVLNYFDKSKDTIRSICEDSLANLFLSDFEKYRATVNAAKEYFNSYSKHYKQSKEKFDLAKKEVDDMFALYKKYGRNWIEQYSNKEKAKAFDKIISKFSDVSKQSDIYINIWYQMFFDMTESKEALERFKSNCDLDNENVKKAIERLDALYNKEITSYLDETVEEFKRKCEEMRKETAADAVVGLLKKKSKITGFLAENIIAQAYKEKPAVAEYDWIESTNNAFNNAVKKLKNTSPDSKKYSERVKSVEEAFNAAKKAQLKFFKLMQSSAKTETDKKYYKYCYETINNASLNDWSSLDIMYKSEYNGSNFNPLTDLNYDF